MEQTIKILSVLLVIVPIGAFILGYWLCSREYKQQIAQLEEDHKNALIQKNLVHIAALEKFGKDLDTIKELKDGRIEMLERQLIDNIVIGINIVEPEQVNTPREQLFKDIQEIWEEEDPKDMVNILGQKQQEDNDWEESIDHRIPGAGC